jgi:hypothetical protein
MPISLDVPTLTVETAAGHRPAVQDVTAFVGR